MRLIDADAFKQYIIDGYEMVADRFTTKELKEEALKVSMEFCKDIDEQPTSRDLIECINELCERCGSYRYEHIGACSDCRWYKIKRGN